ncbi:MAG: hypothetical protein AAGC95_10810 [Pseudomonadota bacterium]
MVYVVLAAAIIVFMACFKALALVPRMSRIVETARSAQSVIGSKTMTDDQKEEAAQKAAVALAGGMVGVLGRVAVCVLAPVALVWIGAQTGAYTTVEATAAATNWVFITVSSIVMIVAFAIVR